MSDQDRIKAKLHKLLALARQGVGGEKENAESMLNKLLARHGMTIEDLDDAGEQRVTRWFCFKDKNEQTLLTHCVLATLGRAWDGTCWKSGRQKVRGFDLTNAEFAQVDLLYAIHRKAMAKFIQKQVDSARIAYLSTNRLFAQDGDREEGPSTLSPEDKAAILGMMMGLRPTPVHRAITSGRAA